jgi:hypothetical protein
MSVVNTAPTGLAPTGSFTIPSRLPGAVIGTFTADDPGDTLTYSVLNPRFVFVGNELRLADNTDLFPFDGTSLSMAIRVTDAGGLFQQLTFTFAVVQTAFEWNYALDVTGAGADPHITGIGRVGTSLGDVIAISATGTSTEGFGGALIEGVNLRLRDGTAVDRVTIRGEATGGNGFGTAAPESDGSEGHSDVFDVTIVANNLIATVESTGFGGHGSADDPDSWGGEAYGHIIGLDIIADRSLDLYLGARATGGEVGDAFGTGFGGDAEAVIAEANIRGGDEADVVELEVIADATQGGFASAVIDTTDIGLRGGNDMLLISISAYADDNLDSEVWGGFNLWAGNAGFDTLDFSGSLTHGVVLLVGDGPGGMGFGAFILDGSFPALDPGLTFSFATFEAFIGTAMPDMFLDGIGAQSYMLGDFDVLVRDPGRGADTIVADPDLDWIVSLAGYGPALDSYEELQGRMRQVGSDVQVSLGGGGSLTFAGVTTAQLTSDHFDFLGFGPPP